jgi:hypothetical protein
VLRFREAKGIRTAIGLGLRFTLILSELGFWVACEFTHVRRTDIVTFRVLLVSTLVILVWLFIASSCY